MSSQDTYQITRHDRIAMHHLTDTPLVRDMADDSVYFINDERKMHLHVMVRSGDYFVTLATKLDDLANTVKKKDPHSAIDLEVIVSDLLYLQREYKISQK